MQRFITDIAIVGAGPSGMMLAKLLHNAGIRAILIERQPMQHVLTRIRAGVLEQGSVNLLTQAGVGARVAREGQRHSGFMLSYGDDQLRIDLESLVNSEVTVYGQTEVTKDLYDALNADGIVILDHASETAVIDLDTEQPAITGVRDDGPFEVRAQFVVGCDGFRGIARQAIPESVRTDYERIYPFGWLGILSETKPANHELIYASHPNGFSLCSMRSERLSRYYIQCSLQDTVDQWSDERFWETLKSQIPQGIAQSLETGPSIEKSIAPLRSFVCEPLQYQRLFIAGDAGHIVPPTGAKGLNLAFSDIHYLSSGLISYFHSGDETGLNGYSDKALKRIWKSERFSWWMTSFLHKFESEDTFAEKMRRAEFEFLCQSRDYQRALAENYIGLPY